LNLKGALESVLADPKAKALGASFGFGANMLEGAGDVAVAPNGDGAEPKTLGVASLVAEKPPELKS
jgi:hypothetical protein